MKEEEFQSKIIVAAKWSSTAEIAAKLVTPVINMILARVLAPEAFGVVTTATMIISFADMFTDSGFQKYLVQHEFGDEEEKYKNANVAFWTNFSISILLWGIIILYSEQLATLVGNPGLGNVIILASFQLPLTSFSSIQMALYRRSFDFKTLFIVRTVSIFIPVIITIPLVLLGLNFWALIIGNLTIQLSNAIILTVKSVWKPKFSYSVKILKEMLSFSIWSLVEEISIWLSIWVDTFIIGSALNPYYLGLYKTSTSMVNSLVALITASIVPVLFSTLSRLQEDTNRFNNVFLKFQRIISIFIFPLGVGVYLYSDISTEILLGTQWKEASNIIGIWALTRAIKIIFCNLSSEAYRAKGKPILSLLAQVLHLVVLIPACIISVRSGFWTLIYTRSWIQMQFVLVHLIIMKFAIGIPILSTVKNVIPTAISAIAMGFFGYLLQHISDTIIWNFTSIILSALFYFGILHLFPRVRKEIFNLMGKLILKKNHVTA
jgi:PST family polysaccharide transporter